MKGSDKIEKLYGMEVISSETLFDTIEVQKRKHKKKRINKKWIKRYGYKIIHIPKKEVFIFENKIIGHPKTIKKIAKTINNLNKKEVIF